MARRERQIIALLMGATVAAIGVVGLLWGHARAQAVNANPPSPDILPSSSAGNPISSAQKADSLSFSPASANPQSATFKQPANSYSSFSGSWTLSLSSGTVRDSNLAGFRENQPFILSPPRRVAPFPIVLNRAVERYVDEYLRDPRSLRARLLSVHPFLHDMAKILVSYGVPKDFICLAFAESAFSDNKGGPWQLTKTTARSFGLRINKWVDERLDPIKSTQVAARYLRYLHDFAGDWLLTIVMWNTGENSSIPVEELKQADYEELSEFLPRRTRLLIERFMALAYITNHPSMLGLNLSAFTDDDSARPLHVSITVPPSTPLEQVARMAHTSVGMLHLLNPALLRDRVPPGSYYTLRIPGYAAGLFADLKRPF